MTSSSAAAAVTATAASTIVDVNSSSNGVNGANSISANDAELVEALRQTLSQKLNESGEEKRLKDDLRQQLIDCGWREQVKLRCKAIIKERGMDITVEELIGAVSQSANDSVPDEIRNDVLLKLKHFLSALERGGDAP